MTEIEEPLAYPFPPASSVHHPSPVFARLREERPVVRIRTPDGNTAWLATRYEDVRQVLLDPRFSRAAAAGPDVPLTGIARLAKESMLGMDPPEHTRLRRLVASAFTARRVNALRPRVVKLVDDLLTAMQPLRRPADLVENLSLRLPLQVIGDLIGVPEQERRILHDWADTVMGGWTSDPGVLDATIDRVAGYFGELIEAKRKNPADDLMTVLIAARDEEDRLTERELVVLCLGLLIVGHATTVGHINMFLLTLLRHPGEFAKLRERPELVPQAVEELLRFIQLSDGGGTLPRVTTEEVELGGVRLPAGAVVMQAVNSGNRDPHQFPEPDRLDLDRTANQHLSFGVGVHHCIGASLARMELQEALHGLLRHMPDVRVAVPESELKFKQGMFIKTLEELPVEW
ncbi:cytochrome P450 [Amycolatopsis sp. NPDC021455]|uniref:cytochrome P450 n=1 Tax=Amycolatopsis sp. NPDC021455 TaxID=3154901 RepID=UPI003406A780